MKLLLASKSRARQQMLAAAGLTFEVATSLLDEEAAKAGLIADGLAPQAIAARLAGLKAAGVADAAGALVLGADQVLERNDGSTLSKPGSRAEAADQLRALAGRAHRLHSAAAIVEQGETVWSTTETAILVMRPLSDAFIEAYLDAEYEAVRWNVGAYRIEGPGVQLFESVEGSHFVILGLPLVPLLGYLRARGLLAS